MLKEFYLIAVPNKKIMIYYFQDKLKLSIKAQLDKHSQNRGTGDEINEKTINVKAEISFQLLL